MDRPDDEPSARAELLARVYSREGQDEAEQEFVEPDGQRVRMRPSEWALAEFDRRGAGAATEITPPDAASPAVPGPTTEVAVAATPARRWPLVALLVASAVIGAVLAIGTQWTMLQVGGAADPDAPTGAELASVVAVFENPPPDERSVPPSLRAEFRDLRRVFEPSSNGGAFGVYAARQDDDLYCLVLLRPTEQYASSCGTAGQIARLGLRVLAVVGDASSAQHQTGEPDPTASPPWLVEVHWNRDGTFSLSGGPLDRRDD